MQKLGCADTGLTYPIPKRPLGGGEDTQKIVSLHSSTGSCFVVIHESESLLSLYGLEKIVDKIMISVHLSQ